MSKRGKTDAADAASICEAVTRPTMRFVPIKTGLPLVSGTNSATTGPIREEQTNDPKFARLFAGGNLIRTIGPALVKGLSAVADE
jgi:transposase